MTAKQFCELNPDLPKSQNMRDLGTTLPRSIPSGKTALEFLNSKLISEGASLGEQSVKRNCVYKKIVKLRSLTKNVKKELKK